MDVTTTVYARRLAMVRRALFTIVASALISVPAFGQWPQWGGPGRDFRANASGLATKWPDEGPKRLWSRPLGGGFSSIALDEGRLFTMYRSGDDEIVVALSAETGKTIWEHKIAAPMIEGIDTKFGKGPNATPTVVGDKVYTLGVTGMLHGLDKKTGKVVWSHDLIKEFGATPPEFGFSSSPIVHKKSLVAAVGGKGCGMMAFDLTSGSVLWQKHDFENTYSSPIVINVDGQDQVVTLVDREVVGLNPVDGELLWRHEHINQWKTNISTPVWGKDNLLFTTSGGEAGSRVLKLSRKGGKTTVKEVWAHKKASVGQSNVIRVGDHLYGCAGHGASSFITGVHLETGETTWRERGYRQAMMIYGDGKFIILDGEGMLSLATATPEAFTVLSTFRLFEDKSWTIPTLDGTRLYARDLKTITALDLG